MTTVYDVPAKELIEEIAKTFHQDKAIQLPEENTFVRTGVHKENPPENKDWWYIRCASILRKVYMSNGIGIEHLRNEYGGKRDRGSKPYKARGGSGSIARRAVQQLEKAGYVTKIRGKGRIVTPKGRSFLDNISHNVMKSLETSYPELKKY
jgi:small subunit ribosomal protein S19e